MRIDWASMITILLAIVLAELFCRSFFSGGSIGGSSTSVGVKTYSPAEPIIIYANPIDEYLKTHYPNAGR